MLAQPRPVVAREMRLCGAVVEADLPRLREYLDDVLYAEPQRLVVDLSTCPGLHSAAIDLLASAQQQLGETGGVVELRGTPEEVRAQLRSAGVDALFAHTPAKQLASVLPLR